MADARFHGRRDRYTKKNTCEKFAKSTRVALVGDGDDNNDDDNESKPRKQAGDNRKQVPGDICG